MDEAELRSGIVTVDEVTNRKSMMRFRDLPHALHGDDPRWVPPITGWDRFRLDPHRNPYFDAGDAAYLLARRRGRPAGRVVAHLAAPGAEGRLGFWCVGDDPEVAAALLEACRTWLDGHGCRSMTGPYSFTDDDEPGLLVAGVDGVGMTGRPWNPPWEAELLVANGGTVADERQMWRLSTTELDPELAESDDRPGQAGSYVDRRLVLDGIAAVPDVAGALRGTGLRSAWSLAKRAREGDWDDAVVVRCSGDPAVLVPALLAAAGRAGYQSVVAPWSPDPNAEPETVHRRYRIEW